LAPAARRARSRPRWVAGHLPWDARADLRAGASVTWERERYVGGGYATFETEFDPTLRAALTQPLPRMAFAGEHTSRENQGYIEGAVESGERAAKELAALLR
ncbi:MAG TPA: FAD-dependent oxidoreductase, partial [Planctomycetota bacterium]|nr:FAD-dependent oxidoreductase [Planctomycetota bacterium]